jgi:hypothetical protein
MSQQKINNNPGLTVGSPTVEVTVNWLSGIKEYISEAFYPRLCTGRVEYFHV